MLGVNERPRFREYVVREHRPSFRFAEPLRVGAVLPRAGVTYYDVPAEYVTRPGYRYTVVNERPVIVDPQTRRVIEVLERTFPEDRLAGVAGAGCRSQPRPP